MIGEPVTRREDARMLTGRGRYVDDLNPAGVTRAAFVRSPHAHARIAAIDITEAARMPGVLAVLTGADYARDGLGDIPCVSIPPSVMGGKWFRTPFAALMRDRVLCVGHAVAMVVAATYAEALDAAEKVRVDYEPLPAAASVAAALAPGAPLVWPDRPDNLCFTHHLGDAGKTEQAFSRAHHVTRIRLENQRVGGNPLEPRGALGSYDPFDERFRLVSSAANPHRIRLLLAEHIFRVPAHRVQVISGDVGGGFGTKGGLYPEEVLVLWAAQKIGRAVKWTSDRSEAFVSDFNGRDQLASAELALDQDGRILALRVESNFNLGCQVGPSTAHPPLVGSRMLSGTYAIPAMHVTIRGVLTHTRTLTTYRGAGRPEATYLVERILDKAAAELAIDPLELRRRNVIPREAMPYRTAVGETYDCGDFRAVLDAAIVASDADGYSARAAASRARGKLRGRGVSLFIEVCASLSDRMEIRFDSTGDATIYAGTFSYGQGHETVYPQLVAGWLGLPIERISVIQGDTDVIAYGRGSFGSRSMTIGGSALLRAAEAVIDKGKRMTAHLLEAAPADIEFANGVFRIAGSDRSIRLADLAKRTHIYGPTGLPAEFSAGFDGVGHFTAEPQNYPYGCHVVELEVDPETGVVTLDTYCAVDDVGRVINPLLLEGQMHGAIAQGIGQALLEAMRFDTDGQLLTGSYMDYAMPRAGDMPAFAFSTANIPTDTNPLGVKGGAELGTVGAPPAIIAAIVNALAPLGVTELPMPATPHTVWRAIQAAVTQSPPSRTTVQRG